MNVVVAVSIFWQHIALAAVVVFVGPTASGVSVWLIVRKLRERLNGHEARLRALEDDDDGQAQAT